MMLGYATFAGLMLVAWSAIPVRRSSDGLVECPVLDYHATFALVFFVVRVCCSIVEWHGIQYSYCISFELISCFCDKDTCSGGGCSQCTVEFCSRLELTQTGIFSPRHSS